MGKPRTRWNDYNLSEVPRMESLKTSPKENDGGGGQKCNQGGLKEAEAPTPP